MTIDGTLDSIKTMSITAYSGASTVASYYNNFTITFSKQHGFVTLFEFYGFPYCVDDIPRFSPNWFPSPYFGGNDVFYPVLPFIHNRLDSVVKNINISKIDNVWKYQPGNEWIVEDRSGYCPTHLIQHDSIISAIPLGADSLIIEMYRHYYWNELVNCGQASAFLNIGHLYDTTIVIVPKILFLGFPNIIHKITEYKMTHPWSYTYHDPPETYVTPFCGSQVIVKDTSKSSYPLSTFSTETKAFAILSGYGITIDELLFAISISLQHSIRHPYIKIGSCITGTKFSFKTLDVNDVIDSKALLDIYPNPSNQYFIIEPKSALDISSIDVYDMQGKHLMKHNALPKDKKIEVSNLSKGLYLLLIKSDKGLIRKMIQKE